MNYAHIYWNRTCDGPGVRVALYLSGCDHFCANCHNREAWDPNYGSPFTEDVKQKVLEGCDHPWITGLSLLGGDPLYAASQPAVLDLLTAFRARFGSSKTVWLWTGCVLERDLLPSSDNFRPSVWHLWTVTDAILRQVDVVVDGPFVEALKEPNLAYRGSTNQRVLAMRNGAVSSDVTPSN